MDLLDFESLFISSLDSDSVSESASVTNAFNDALGRERRKNGSVPMTAERTIGALSLVFVNIL